MTGPTPSQTPTGLFAAFLKGDAIPWIACGMTPHEFLRACSELDVAGLIYERLRTLPDACAWPEEIHEVLGRDSRAQTARELLIRKEVISVLEALASEGIEPLLLKGTALAYSVYANPASRPRVDTDLLIRRNDVDRVRRAMGGRGYIAPPYCDGDLLFCQFPLRKSDEFGLTHTFDFHWKISTQSIFADVLAFEEIAGDAVALPPLGVHARTASPAHALLLACIHPVMHHRNVASLIWSYDVHLLASRLFDQFDVFSELAVAKQVSAICAQQLSAARGWFDTRIPDSAMMKLRGARAPEPSAAYLCPNRRWGDELISSMEGLPRWSDRLRLLREVALPNPTYMLKAYHIGSAWPGATLLPLLYLHRLSSGGWKVITGQK